VSVTLDADPFDGSFFDALYVGSAGTVVIVTQDGKSVSFVGAPASRILPVRGKRVASSGTTAGDLVALKRV
jgi:hypothetical protein